MKFTHVNFEHKNIGYHHLLQLLVASADDLGYSTSINCKSNEPNVLNFILEPHNYIRDVLPANRIFYNTEPFLAKEALNQTKYGGALQSFLIDNHVADYSEKNYNWLKRNSNASRIKVHLPLGFHPVLLDIEDRRHKTVDTIFYGVITKRRQILLDRLRQEGVNVHASSKFYAERLIERLSSTRLLLNIHSHDDGRSLEMVRLFHPISNGVLVLSEYSDKTEIPLNSTNYMLFARYDEIPETVKDVLIWTAEKRYLIAHDHAKNFQRNQFVPLLKKVFIAYESLT